MRIENISLLISIFALLAIAVMTFIPAQKKILCSMKQLWIVACIAVIIPTILLVGYQLCGRFDFQYVYEHTCTNLPIIYKISALWSGQQGSLLLWATILTLFGFYILQYQNQSKKAVGIYALITLFVVLLSFMTKPFVKIGPMSDGLGLTDALQDPWMVVHPPLVFISYTGMAILFALFPIVDRIPATVKRWAQISFAFLGIGIFSGSIWAYRSLGWGGFWAWDAIENIALVPWLILSAYLHGKAHFSKAMCILPFSLAAFGTFMTRSGILENISVHSYAGNDNQLTIIVLLVLLVAILLTLGIVYKPIKNCRWQQSVTDTLWLFRQLTYLFAVIILLATILQIVCKIETLTSFYNSISAIYAVLLSLLLVRFLGNHSSRQIIFSLIFNTLVSMLILVAFSNTPIIMLLLFWFCLLPISFALSNITQICCNPHHFMHLLLSIFMIGIIASEGFSAPTIFQAEIHGDTVTISDTIFTKQQIDQHKTLLIHTLHGDYIVTDMQPTTIGKNNLIAYCEYKPLIFLFWLGGFGILGYSFEALFKKNTNTLPTNST